MRRRVTYPAAAMAGLAIINHVVMYVTGVAEVESAFQEIREIVPKDVRGELKMPGGATLFAGGLGKLFGTIVFSMFIPLCGYYGVKNTDAKLLGAFAACNGCCAIGSILTVLISVGALVLVDNVEPKLQPWLMSCDPRACIQLSQHNQTIDCLSGLGRRPAFEGIPHLSESCPQAFLKCDGDENDPCMFPIPGRPCPDTERVAFCKSKADPNRPGKCDFLGRCTWIDQACQPVGLPFDPIASSCDVDEQHVQAFQSLIELVPVITPKITTLLTVKVILTLPAIVLACLGLCWGFQLFHKVNSGYAVLTEPGFRTQQTRSQPEAGQQMAMRQPVQGTVSGTVLQQPV